MTLKKYQIVKEYLLERILNGTYIPDLPLPPERELAITLNVNRMTVRRAIEELMYDGYLIRKKGSGTYLTREKVRKDELLAAGKEEKEDAIRLISCRFCKEGSYGYQMLHIPENDSEGYWRIRRVRSIHMIPYAYEDIYLRENFFPIVDESFYSLGLHDIITEKGTEPQILRQQQVEALLCLKTTGTILNVKEGSPILQVKTWFKNQKNNQVILYCRSYHPGDSYSFQSEEIELNLSKHN